MNRNTRKHSMGFTLIELLVVLVIIGVLMGLLFPGVRMAQQRAADTASTQLCIQTATAWDSVLLAYRRFPSKELIKACAADAQDVGGDIRFSMDVQASSLLNWWEKANELSQFDLGNYRRHIVPAGYDFGWSNIDNWRQDQRLDRSPLQLRWGLIAPWGERHVRGASEGDQAVESVVKTATVNVMLDTDGDNILTVPADLGKVALDSSGNPLQLRKSAIAWVYNGPDKKKVLCSW